MLLLQYFVHFIVTNTNSDDTKSRRNRLIIYTIFVMLDIISLYFSVYFWQSVMISK